MNFPSYTETYHHESYAAINAKNPHLSLAGKVVLITGAGSGIGERTVQSFAEAGAAHIGLLGRTQSKLDKVAGYSRTNFPKTKFHVHPADITNKTAIFKALQDFASAAGKIDILIANAGEGDMQPAIKDADSDFWIKGTETNIKGSFLLAQAFLNGPGKLDGVLVNVSSGFSYVLGPSFSSYAVSKEAAVRMYGIVAMENPDLRVVHLQPGVVATPMNAKSGAPAQDDANLPADFMVWLCSSEAGFLKSKYVWANWDVDELKARKEEINSGKTLEMWLTGFPNM